MIIYSTGFTVPASPPAREFAASFFRYLSTSARDGKSPLQPNPVRRMPGGMEKIVSDGFVLLGAGSMENRELARSRTEDWMTPVSGEKLGYQFVET